MLRLPPTLLLALSLLAASCSDDPADVPDGGLSDGGLDAPADVAIADAPAGADVGCAETAGFACAPGMDHGCCDDVLAQPVCTNGKWECPQYHVREELCCGFGPTCAPYPGRITSGCPIRTPDAGR